MLTLGSFFQGPVQCFLQNPEKIGADTSCRFREICKNGYFNSKKRRYRAEGKATRVTS